MFQIMGSAGQAGRKLKSLTEALEMPTNLAIYTDDLETPFLEVKNVLVFSGVDQKSSSVLSSQFGW